MVVEFKLTFKKQLDNEKALGALKEGIKDGKMGSLKVDPESLKVKRDSEGNLVSRIKETSKYMLMANRKLHF